MDDQRYGEPTECPVCNKPTPTHYLSWFLVAGRLICKDCYEDLE
jgi:hypothetical protein